jgi:hypothetical protein
MNKTNALNETFVAPATDVGDRGDPADNVGIINPYALAELITGRKIPWNELPDVPRMLEEILETPFEELFDPVHGGPLFTGLRLTDQMILEQVRSPLLDVEMRVSVNDLEDPLAIGVEEIRTLADLGPRFEARDVGAIPVVRAENDGPQHLRLTLRMPERERLQRLARVLRPEIVNTIAFDPTKKDKDKETTPPTGTWADPGQFFNKAAEYFDPKQGAVANCYYIAALAAVAWAMPYRIKHMTRAIGQAQHQFTNLIRFYKPDSGGVVDKEIEVTELLPVNAAGNPIYARSTEAGEIWPGVYEKAFAKYLTGHTGDFPDITATALGDGVLAMARLTGGTQQSRLTVNNSSDALFDFVRGNSLSRRTVNPMVASTYSTGGAAEQNITYAGSKLAASHVYTVLGWDYREGVKYIILRNPWGHTGSAVGTLESTFWAYDISWWRPIDLTENDGIFGLAAGLFKTYFRRIGVVK